MSKKEQQFVETVWEFYERHGRQRLPWRKTQNPYRILVSEIMLQQTQVDRVIPKYTEFLKTFPTVVALARAPLGDVLRAWQGLGYNRRAKMLHNAAQTVVHEYGGRFPKTYNELRTLSGVGSYTAGAVMAFAYQKPIAIIETNIRTVFIHHFFKDVTDVHDNEILKYVERTLPHERVHEWYAALMDYGTYLKKEYGNKNVQSTHYQKQSAFKGSDREIRGIILRTLAQGSQTVRSLQRDIPAEKERLIAQLRALIREGLVVKKASVYSLPS